LYEVKFISNAAWGYKKGAAGKFCFPAAPLFFGFLPYP
jgi:hypothetical protein